MNSEVRITLRFPSELRDSVISSAEANNRSMNAEIVYLVQGALSGDADVASLLRLALTKIENSPSSGGIIG